jgi:hypothetical protein
MGIPEYEATRYEGKIQEGNMLISVHADDSTERDRAKTIFEQAGAEEIASTEEAWMSVGALTSVGGRTRAGARAPPSGRPRPSCRRPPAVLPHVIHLDAMEDGYASHRTRSDWLGVPLAAGQTDTDISGAVFSARLHIR